MSLSANQPSGRALMEAGLFRCLHSLSAHHWCRNPEHVSKFIHSQAGLSRDPL